MANTFRPTLNRKASVIIKEEEKQDELHKRYKNYDREVVIVEDTPLRTVFKTIGHVISTIFMILGILLATVGIIAIIFEAPRTALLELYNGLRDEIHIMFGI